MDTNLTLDEASRARLDSVVQRMTSDSQPPQNIQAVVDDFKQKYGKPPAAAAPAKQTNPLIEAGKGFAKGVVSTAQEASKLGQGLLSQTAGRGVNALLGKGFTPFSDQQLGSTLSSGELGQKTTDLIQTHNTAQNAGAVAEKAAELLLPAKGALVAAKGMGIIKSAAQAAAEAVAPKLTAKTATQAITQGRGVISGLLGKAGVALSKGEQASAKAVEGLVKGKSAVKDSNAVIDGIGKTAEDLVGRLKAMEVQPTLQPEELQTLAKNAIQKVTSNHFLPEGASKTAVNIFKEFISYLPKGRPATAEDILAARKQLDASIRAMKGGNVFDPAKENVVSIALRAIRQGANEILASKAPDVAVKELLARQSAMYDALEALAPKAAKELGTTRVGRFVTRHPLISGALKYGTAPVLTGLGVGEAAHLLGGKE